MAAYDIHKHFKALRVDTGRRKGRSDPFATGFEDELDQTKRSRSKVKAPPVETTSTQLPVSSDQKRNSSSPPHRRKSPATDEDADNDNDDKRKTNGNTSDDDNFLTYRSKRSTARGLSPSPSQLSTSADTDTSTRRVPTRDPRALAVGNLAYLDESSDEEDRSPARRRRGDNRGLSPAPFNRSNRSSSPIHARSSTPKGEKESQIVSSSVPRHTVASPFAGTKYLQDSDSEDDEEAVTSRQNSTDGDNKEDDIDNSLNGLLTPTGQPEVKRVLKPKSSGSGVSWRAFSAGRTEQRNAELEALKADLRKRGKTISFGTHALTDDGRRVPIDKTYSAGKTGGRGRSPPRSAKDTAPSRDEVVDELQTYDPSKFKTNPFTGRPIERANSTPYANPAQDEPFDDSRRPSSAGKIPDIRVEDVTNHLTSKLVVSPQTIPESRPVAHSIDQHTEESPPSMYGNSAIDPINFPLSRDSSTRSLRNGRSMRIISSASRRPSRRATSHTSVSPAQAFLSSWNKEASTDPQPEAKPDDEGQAIGLRGEYIIGRTIDKGGFGVIKEVRTMNERSSRQETLAVKIVRKNLPDASEQTNDQTQQDLEHEVSVWRHLKHPHILSLHAVYETDYATFCVMDLNQGGTLFDMVRKSRQLNSESSSTPKALFPRLAKRYAYQLASALRYLHEDIKVCHRDIKLENCLVDMSGPDADSLGGVLRLCDFGLADFLHAGSVDDETDPFDNLEDSTIPPNKTPRNNTTSSVIGTLEYASPKGLSVNRKLFETAGDVWAYGVIVYALCTGDLPFKHPMPSKTVDAILHADWDITALRQASSSGVGEEVCELVRGCLERDISDRWTIGDCLRSLWFDGCSEDGDEEERRTRWR